MSREYANEFLDHIDSCEKCQEIEAKKETTELEELEAFKLQDLCYQDSKLSTDDYINEDTMREIQ